MLQSLLGNRKLVENDAVRIASSKDSTAELLAVVAQHPEWGGRHEVRLALLHNPRTPVPTALTILGRLDHKHLHGLASDASFPKIVRVGAERELGKASEEAESVRPDDV